jgi:DNA-binding response OmpR family regulator
MNKPYGKTIVIVDDKAEVINYVVSTLGKMFEMQHAFDGKERLKMFEDLHPNLMISDTMKLELDGIGMVKILKEDFSLSHVPVIMLTAKSTIDDQIHGIDTGAEAYISKFFDANYLVSDVNMLLKQRNSLNRKHHENNYSAELKITSRDEEFLMKTIQLIQENCHEPEFNVAELVKISYVGRTVFFNKIKRLTGLSPVEFSRKIKIQLAAKHISENNCGVAEAAYICGFSSVKYFSKCFRIEYGINPSEYKKKSGFLNKATNRINEPESCFV